MGAQLDSFIVNTLGLTKLPPYLPTFWYSFFGFSFVHQVLVPWASKKWFPVAYGSKGHKARNAWSIHVVSQIHTLIIVPFSLWAIYHESPERGADRAFGWDSMVGHVHAIACGYFLWDSLDAVVNFTDIGSTFFLNIHWFLDKTNRTGSKAQLVNGIFLLGSFFGVRLVYGGKMSYEFLRTLMQVRHEMPWKYIIVYATGNALLTSLNWFWFSKMISALKRRFEEDDPKDAERRRLNTHAITDEQHSNVEEGYGTVHDN
ncbi:hypothetical protein H0H92_014838 [Tricholoma furcatifolium]|nr:hypothetical protein H0H92_014838 [Tricholoma furcatifolium]